MTSEFYDLLDSHLTRESDLARAVVPMGMLLAWCVNMQLLNTQMLQAHERLILRIRVEEAHGSELLVACGGDLRRDFFTRKGQQFLDSFYPRYLAVYADLFGDNFYATADTWATYRVVAKVLTAELMGPVPDHATGNRQNLLSKVVRLFRK